MAPLVPAPLTTAPEPGNRRYGLFSAASGPIDLPTGGEGGGVRYVVDTCGEAYPYGITCYGQDGNPAAPAKPLDGEPDETETGVFAVLSTLNCGAVGYTIDEYRNKIRRRFEAAEQAAVERALWTGEDFQGNPLGIRSLDDVAVAIPAGYDEGLVTDVVGALERYAYTENGYGFTAYIHAPVEVAAFAAEAGLVLPDGPRKVTPMGSIWVFGAYPPGEVIVTGQTTVWRAPETQVYDAFENETNERLLVAERAYAVGFDCFAGRAEFNPLEAS
jgi:hypothetical protein